MTRDQLKFYLIRPHLWLAYQWNRLVLWWAKKRALKKVKAKMADLREMEHLLRLAAYPSCPKCFGLGQRGFNLTTKAWAACRCTFNPRTQDRVDAHPWLREAK